MYISTNERLPPRYWIYLLWGVEKANKQKQKKNVIPVINKTSRNKSSLPNDRLVFKINKVPLLLPFTTTNSSICGNVYKYITVLLNQPKKKPQATKCMKMLFLHRLITNEKNMPILQNRQQGYKICAHVLTYRIHRNTVKAAVFHIEYWILHIIQNLPPRRNANLHNARLLLSGQRQPIYYTFYTKTTAEKTKKE